MFHVSSVVLRVSSVSAMLHVSSVSAVFSVFRVLAVFSVSRVLAVFSVSSVSAVLSVFSVRLGPSVLALLILFLLPPGSEGSRPPPHLLRKSVAQDEVQGEVGRGSSLGRIA